jgi:signal transduction histidine kinase
MSASSVSLPHDGSSRLDRTLEMLERVSCTLREAPEMPVAVCDAVVGAAAESFDGRWAAMVFSVEYPGVGTARMLVPTGESVIQRLTAVPGILAAVADRTLAARAPVLANHAEGTELGGGRGTIAAAPMHVRGEPAGILAVGLSYGAQIEPSDMSILVTLANHGAVALHRAWLLQENRQRTAELDRCESDLMEALLRLEQAGRREILSDSRARSEHELRDSVSQHLLTIGMNLEWCRRQQPPSPAVLEHVLAAQSLARSAMDEIREVTFGLVGV